MSAHLVDHPPDHRDDPHRGMRRRLGRAKNTFDEGTPLAGRLPARSPLPTTLRSRSTGCYTGDLAYSRTKGRELLLGHGQISLTLSDQLKMVRTLVVCRTPLLRQRRLRSPSIEGLYVSPARSLCRKHFAYCVS